LEPPGGQSSRFLSTTLVKVHQGDETDCFSLVFRGLSLLDQKSLTISVKHSGEVLSVAAVRKCGLVNDLAAECDGLAASARGSH
jgi:hypothetical protein